MTNDDRLIVMNRSITHAGELADDLSYLRSDFAPLRPETSARFGHLEQLAEDLVGALRVLAARTAKEIEEAKPEVAPSRSTGRPS